MGSALDEIKRVITDPKSQVVLESLHSMVEMYHFDSPQDFINEVESTFSGVPNFFFVPVILRDFSAKVASSDIRKKLSILHGQAKVDYLSELFESTNLDDPTALKAVAAAVNDASLLLKNLDEDQRNQLRKIFTSLPEPLCSISLPEESLSFDFVSPAPPPPSAAPATALLEIISLAIQFPQGCALLPYDWSRFGVSFESAVSGRPDLFSWRRDSSGLISVSQHANPQALAALRAAAQGEKFPAVFRLDRDQQFMRLLEAKAVWELGGAREKVRQISRQNPTGCAASRFQRGLVDAGFGPLPLEWFSEIIFVCDGIVRLRNFPKVVSNPVGEPLRGKIIAEIRKSGRAKLGVLARIAKSENILEILERIPEVFFEPEKIFPLPWVEECIYNFQVSAPPAPPASAFRLLCDSILARLRVSERLPSEDVLRWCRALNVKPRVVCQALRKEIFWSHPESDLEVLMRRQPLKTPQTLPLAPLTALRAGLRAGATTVEKLIKEAGWGKGSDNRKEYGNLRDILKTVGEVFYDPKYVYSRPKIDKLLILPDWDAEKPSRLAELDAAWEARREISDTLKTYLADPTICPLRKYPIEQLKIYCMQRDIQESELLTAHALFFPLKIIYLRAGVPAPAAPAEAAAVHRALSALPFNACDCDALLRALADSQPLEIVDRLREELPGLGGLAPSGGSWFREMCFYDPENIYLVEDAEKFLAGKPFDRRGLPEEQLPAKEVLPDLELLAYLAE